MSRFNLFRWHKRLQVDIRIPAGYLSLGLDRKAPWWASWVKWRPIAYFSPDATPSHENAWGLKGWQW